MNQMDHDEYTERLFDATERVARIREEQRLAVAIAYGDVVAALGALGALAATLGIAGDGD